MQQAPNNKLATSQIATLAGLSAMQITHARKELGRGFEGGTDHEFVRVAKQWTPHQEEDQRGRFTK